MSSSRIERRLPRSASRARLHTKLDLSDNLSIRLAQRQLDSAVTGTVWLTCYGSNGARHMLAVTFHYFVIWGLIVPGCPMMLRCFLLLREYSKLPLRPAVSMVNKFTLNRVGRMLFIVSLPWTACFTLLTLIGYTTFSTELVFSQVALFYFMVAMGRSGRW